MSADRIDSRGAPLWRSHVLIHHNYGDRGMIEPQALINFAGGVILAGIGWFARQIWEAVKELRKDLHQIEIDLPHNYVKRVDYASDLGEIKAMLQKIFDRLEQKADKP